MKLEILVDGSMEIIDVFFFFVPMLKKLVAMAKA
jgi:hypothetical protein